MSYIFPIGAAQRARDAKQVRLIALQDWQPIELKIIPASGTAWAGCEQWLTAVISQAEAWVTDLKAPAPVATLLIMDDSEHDLQSLTQLRAAEPDSTIFAVLQSAAPGAIARALQAGADDVWHGAMPTPEAWARLSASVRRRTLAEG